MKKQDLVVIGGGAGGLGVTSAAAQLGLKVTLIEKQAKLGGDCLHYGCVPSKTLIHSAKVAHLMRHADRFGLTSHAPEIDLKTINQHVQSVIDQIQVHDDPERFRSYGANVIFGDGQFLDRHTFEIAGEKISSKRFVIATGSSPFVPPIYGLDAIDYLTNETVFKLTTLPKHLVVLGAGAIGLELAQAFARFGSQVTVIEMLDQILPAVDQQAVETIKTILEQEGVKFYLGSKVVKVSGDNHQKQIQVENKQQQSFIVDADQILVATGRKANIDNLNLPAADVEFTPAGITVDKRLRSSQKHIYAMGDVTVGPNKFTHMAEYHAGVVISNAVFHFPKKVDERVIPSVIYTDPEMAVVGLTEEQAKQRGINYDVVSFDFKDVDRALIEVEAHGFSKLLIRKGKVIGATVVGPHAGELIAEIVLAMQANLSIKYISAAIHAYPTLSQINRRAVNQHFSKMLFASRTKKIVGLLNKIF